MEKSDDHRAIQELPMVDDELLQAITELVFYDNRALDELIVASEFFRNESIGSLNELFGWLRKTGVMEEKDIANDPEFRKIFERLTGTRLIAEKIPEITSMFIREATINVLKYEYRVSKIRRFFTTLTLIIGMLGIGGFSYMAYQRFQDNKKLSASEECLRSALRDSNANNDSDHVRNSEDFKKKIEACIKDDD